MSRFRPRRTLPLPPAVVIGVAAVVLYTAGVGIAVLVGCVDATPEWMRETAFWLAVVFGLALLGAAAEWGTNFWIVTRACRAIDAHRFRDASIDLQLYVEELEKVAGPNDPLTLRWTSTLAHVLLHRGQRMRAMALLALVIDDQLSVLGPNHPDTRRSLRLLERHTDITAPIAPVEAWWQ
jgi:hypothetical protein